MKLERPEGRLLARLLAGERFPGVGEATANRLWDAFGDELVGVLDAGDRNALLRVLPRHSRSQDQVETMLSEWPHINAEPSILASFDRYDVPSDVATKLLNIYGLDAFNRLLSDPYRLLAFSTWSATDALARRMGLQADDQRRSIAACEAALHGQLARGDTLMAGSALKLAAGALLGNVVDDATLWIAADRGAIRNRTAGWQAAGPALMEEAIAQRIASEIRHAECIPTLLPLVDLSPTGIELNPAQLAAVAMAVAEPIALLVGGAGTGKTTVLKAIATAAKSAGRPVHMMALSGRAALRMRLATGERASTISGWLTRVAARQIDLSDLPLIVIDEASMVDLGSLYRIMLAGPPGCRFLLVGDPGQLPPVGFGLTFHALLDVGLIATTELTEVIRQAAETGIPSVARALRDGELPELLEYDSTGVAGVSIATCEARDVVATVVGIRRQLPSAQIVGSIKGRGDPSDGGTSAINTALHEAFASARGLDRSAWLRGEPVIWTVNDYGLDLWNGSLGKVVGMTELGLAVRFDEGDRVIPIELLSHLELAWAITTHKAQGSQFDTVIVPITKSRICDRTLLYTAITRATRRAIFVGTREVLREAVVKPAHASTRRTWLSEATRSAMTHQVE